MEEGKNNSGDCDVVNVPVNMCRIENPNAQAIQDTNIHNNCPNFNPLLESAQNIQKLPAEIMAEIFNHLTHTEKLISRLVCSDWNRGISSILAKSSYFTLTDVDNHEVLLDSKVPWSRIKMSDSPRFTLPSKTREFITTIVLKVSTSDLRESMRILSKFPQLIELDMSILYAPRDQSDSDSDEFVSASEKSELKTEQIEDLRKQIRQSARNLKILAIEFPYERFDTLLETLKCWFSETVGLKKLTFRENRNIPHHPNRNRIDHNPSYSMIPVGKLISKSSRTLKYLEFDFVSKIRNKLLTDLISTISMLDDLVLENFLVPLKYADESWRLEDFKICENFLKEQFAKEQMKSISLHLYSNASQEFQQCIPQNIKFVGNVCPKDMDNSRFSKCQTMEIDSRNSSVFDQPVFPSIRRLHYNVKEPELRKEEFYKALSNSLVNVVEFYFVPDWSLNLQLIIKNFQQLRVLEINSHRGITDSTVSGIEKIYMDELLKQTKGLCIEENVPEEKMNGVSLSSLKHLKKLVLLGSSLTDLGIYYGLQFGSTLKQMTLEIDDEISVRGLKWLGVGNPKLESLELIGKSWKTGNISKSKIWKSKEYFPMLEATGQFKLVKEEY